MNFKDTQQWQRIYFYSKNEHVLAINHECDFILLLKF